MKATFERASPFVPADIVYKEFHLTVYNRTKQIPADAISTFKFETMLISAFESVVNTPIDLDAFKSSYDTATSVDFSGLAPQDQQSFYELLKRFTRANVTVRDVRTLTSIPADIFASPLPNLLVIDFEGTSISTIGDTAFSGLTNLDKLRFFDAQLSPEEISKTAFQGLPSKVNVELTAHLALTYFEEDRFKQVLDNTFSLNVGYQNPDCTLGDFCYLRNHVCDERALWICENRKI